MASKTKISRVTEAELAEQWRHAAGHDAMPPGWTPVGAWIRVSSNAQKERNQVPSIIEYCLDEKRKYWIERWFIVHGESAFHGDQDEDWQKLVQAAERREFRIAVLWMVDRLDRRNILSAVPMVNALLATGVGIEFSEQPSANITPGSTRGLREFTRLVDYAHEESVIKSKRAKADLAERQRVNALSGRPPYGYVTMERGDGYKDLAPTEAGRKWVPVIFGLIGDGWSAQSVAEWLTTEGVPSVTGGQWSPKSVTNIIRNQTYIGERQSRKDGRAVLNGVTKLVDEKVWLAANHRLDNAPRGRRGPTSGESALLTGSLTCGNCGAPMYRNGTTVRGRRYEYYRCAGILPNPKGCGVMIKLAELDALADRAMSSNTRRVYRLEFVAGNAPELKLAIDKIRIKLRNLPGLELTEAEEDAERSRLRAERRELESQLANATPDEWKSVPVLKDDGSPLTEAERWNAADREARRDIIRKQKITAWRVGQGFKIAMNVGSFEGMPVFSTESTVMYDSPATAELEHGFELWPQAGAGALSQLRSMGKN